MHNRYRRSLKTEKLVIGELGNWQTSGLANWQAGELRNWETGGLANWQAEELRNWKTGGLAN